MSPTITQLLIGFLLAAFISGVAWRVRSLSASGALAALALGTITFGLGGLAWAVLLVVFFISSSLLSRAFKRRKFSLNEKFSKDSQRDAGQVLANGGLSGAFVLLHLLFPQQLWPWLAYAASLAAANADTWATEVGVLSPIPPVRITTGRPVERGSSGGITPLGTLAALAGAALIAWLAVLPWPGLPVAFSPDQAVIAWILVSLAGLAGSLADSGLGATLQAIYFCPACQKETERHPWHTCGSPTTPLRGWPFLNNDWVNFACTLCAALLALIGAVGLPLQ